MNWKLLALLALSGLLLLYGTVEVI